MTLFESRNVLDRLETTWKGIFNANWKANISPFLILLLVNIAWGVIASIIVPLTLFIWSMGMNSVLGKGIIVTLLLLILIVSIAIFYWITGNLATISTYLIFEKQEQRVSFRAMEILREAKTYLPSALKFDGYYYSILAGVIFVIFLMLFPFIREYIGPFFQMESKDFYSSTFWEPSLQFALVMILAWGAYFIFALWFSTRYFPTKPGFVLRKSGNYDTFSKGKLLTQGQFWNILGNMIVLSIVISVASWIWNNFIGGSLFGGPSIATEWLTWANTDEFMKNLPQILSFISPWQVGWGMIISLIASTMTNLFRNGFSYVLWKDLSTSIPQSTPSAEDRPSEMKSIE